jgi:hypothetical protein
MEDIEKVLRNLEEKSEDDFLNTEKGKAVLSSIALVKNITREVAAKGSLTCEHDIEDICAYFEGNLEGEEKDKAEEQIFSCDSCFGVYKLLQTGLEEINNSPKGAPVSEYRNNSPKGAPVSEYRNNHTPDWLKENVLEKDLVADQEEKKSIFSGIFTFRNNIGFLASGLTVATIFLLYLGPNQSEKSADMQVAKAPEQVSANKIEAKAKTAAGKAEVKSEPIVPPQPAGKADVAQSSARSIDTKKQDNFQISAGLISQDKIAAENKPATLTPPAEKKLAGPALRKETVKGTISGKNEGPAKKPGNTDLLATKPKPETASVVNNPERQPVPQETFMVAAAPQAETRMKQQSKGEGQVENTKTAGSFADSITKDKEKNVESDKAAEEAKTRADEGTVNTTSQAAAPAMQVPENKLSKKSVEPDDEDLDVSKKDNRDAKAKTGSGYFVTVNSAEFEKPGFIVIHKDIAGKRGEVLASSRYFAPGKYYNIKISVKEKPGTKVQAVVYEDTDNSTLFDSRDKPFIKNNSNVFKIFEVK